MNCRKVPLSGSLSEDLRLRRWPRSSLRPGQYPSVARFAPPPAGASRQGIPDCFRVIVSCDDCSVRDPNVVSSLLGARSANDAHYRRDTPLFQTVADIPITQTCELGDLTAGITLKIQPDDVVLQLSCIFADHSASPLRRTSAAQGVTQANRLTKGEARSSRRTESEIRCDD